MRGHPLLLGKRKTNAVGTKVINRVPLPQEGITKDGQRTNWLREIYRTCY